MHRRRCDRGQIAVATAGVLALSLAVLVALAVFGGAVAHRVRARTAADAVALATVADDPAGVTALVEWYRAQGVHVEPGSGSARARSGPSQAAAWAAADAGTVAAAPAVVAVLARASQLLDHEFTSPQIRGTRLVLMREDAVVFARVAAELGMCESTGPNEQGVAFVLCGAG